MAECVIYTWNFLMQLHANYAKRLMQPNTCTPRPRFPAYIVCCVDPLRSHVVLLRVVAI